MIETKKSREKCLQTNIECAKKNKELKKNTQQSVQKAKNKLDTKEISNKIKEEKQKLRKKDNV